MANDKQLIGVLGLGTMGRNLALNIADGGAMVVGYERDDELAGIAKCAGLRTERELSSLIAALPAPRTILLMITAGAPVDQQIATLRDQLSPGDLIIDGGNSDHRDTTRRQTSLLEHGIGYIGLGVSGGELGARHGPALMAGGTEQDYRRIRPALESVAARAPDGSSCVGWFGEGGAGHFVKMMHNGIEYADMQIIAEIYLLLGHGMGRPAERMADLFSQWNTGDLNSYLIEITAAILRRQDEESGRPLLELVRDTAGQKGTGRLSSIAALELGVPAPTLAEAVHARGISALKEERVAAAGELTPPTTGLDLTDDDLRDALWVARLCAYAQGFAVMAAARAEHGWPLPADLVARVWRAGCILRAAMLDTIAQAFSSFPSLVNLMTAPDLTATLERKLPALRRTVAAAARAGLPVPCLASALAYTDSYFRAELPANLIQAQRDCFGAHGFERTDRPGTHHADWMTSE